MLPVLRKRLARDDVGGPYVDAALELGDPPPLPLLERLRERGWKDDEEPSEARLLDKAIQRFLNAEDAATFE